MKKNTKGWYKNTFTAIEKKILKNIIRWGPMHELSITAFILSCALSFCLGSISFGCRCGFH